MNPTQARDRACELAPVDTQAALAAARAAGDPWFACQGLAWVARFASEGCVDALVAEAFEAGSRAGDPYRVVASAAWPLRALVERGRAERSVALLPDLLELSSRIESLASRAEAMLLVYQAVFPAGPDARRPVLRELARATAPRGHWRQARAIREAVLMEASEDPEFARDFARGMHNDRARSRIEQALARAEYQSPRRFFWHRDADRVP